MDFLGIDLAFKNIFLDCFNMALYMLSDTGRDGEELRCISIQRRVVSQRHYTFDFSICVKEPFTQAQGGVGHEKF